MDTSAREQVLEHQLERHLDFIALTVLLQCIEQRDVNVSDQAKVAETIAGIAGRVIVENQLAVIGQFEESVV